MSVKQVCETKCRSSESFNNGYTSTAIHLKSIFGLDRVLWHAALIDHTCDYLN